MERQTKTAPDRSGPPSGGNQRLGRNGERVAAAYLRAKGLEILGQNLRVGRGEIDLLAREGNTYVVVEVKTRRSHRHGTPSEAVSAQKQRQLSQLARLFLRAQGLTGASVRFDVISLTWLSSPAERPPRLRWIRNAFEMIQDSGG